MLEKLDVLLCKLLGYSSPWFVNPQRSAPYRVYTCMLYAVPAVVCYFMITGKIYFLNPTYSLLLILNVILYTFEIYLNLSFYGFFNINITDFKKSITENQDSLKNIFKNIKADGYDIRVPMGFFLVVIHTSIMAFRAFMLWYTDNLYSRCV